MALVNLSSQSALVTGSSRGIGRAIALTLAQCGADVLVHARTLSPELREVVKAIRGMGRQCDHILADLSLPDERQRFFQEAWNFHPGLDIWINNAGADCLTGENASRPANDKLTLLCRLDLEGTFELTRLAGSSMQARGSGCLVNMGWDQAETGMEGDSGQLFGMIKGGVMAFTLAAAKTYAPQVRVNCLAPGWIKTAWGESADEKWQARAKNESLLERWGTSQDVANACAFLVSPAASFVNGQIIRVNGGFLGSLPAPSRITGP